MYPFTPENALLEPQNWGGGGVAQHFSCTIFNITKLIMSRRFSIIYLTDGLNHPIQGISTP